MNVTLTELGLRNLCAGQRICLPFDKKGDVVTNVPTLELELHLSTHLHDLLIAELDAAGFTGFVQEDECLQAYVPLNIWTSELKSQLKSWLESHSSGITWKETEIIHQDWNEAWERSIKPICIPPFNVRPSWTEAVDGLIDIVVDPKMSFGTGHHETTRLLLRMMPDHLKSGIRVLDAGAGTAILAMASIKLGASSAIAFDIDPWVEENVIENMALNQVSEQIAFRVGGMEVVQEKGFDLVFANINRNVLLSYMHDFASKLLHEGLLFLSGVLVEDQEMMVEAAGKEGFVLIDHAHEGPWWAGVFKLTPSSEIP